MKNEFGLAYVSTNILNSLHVHVLMKFPITKSLTRHLVTLSEKIKYEMITNSKHAF